MELQLKLKDGNAIVTIKDISNENVTLDGNHPLAGKEIFYQVTLLKII